MMKLKRGEVQWQLVVLIIVLVLLAIGMFLLSKIRGEASSTLDFLEKLL